MYRRAHLHGVGVEGWAVSHPRLYGAYPAKHHSEADAQ